MRTRIVKRHYCDHCRKGGFMRPAMEKHEAGCTANPDRVCRMCRMNPEAIQKPMAEIVALIDSFCPIELVESETARKQAETAIREFVHNCPACLLAGSRQSTHWLPFDLDWKAESKNWLGEWGHDFSVRNGYSYP